MNTDQLVEWVTDELDARADPERAAAMAAYLKTDMPLFGVGRSDQKQILRQLVRRFPVETPEEYETAVRALWGRPRREEKYLAIDLARLHKKFITFDRMPLYQQVIEEGAWWDLVDSVAAHLVGGVLLNERTRATPLMREWVDDTDLWLRRSAILSQLLHREETDAAMLFAFCLARAGEQEFFIRKAIGWALRQYARVAPDEVRAFLIEHRDRLSGLSFREASKHLGAMS